MGWELSYKRVIKNAWYLHTMIVLDDGVSSCLHEIWHVYVYIFIAVVVVLLNWYMCLYVCVCVCVCVCEEGKGWDSVYLVNKFTVCISGKIPRTCLANTVTL